MPGPVGLHELDLLRVTRLGAAIRRRARAAGSSEEAAGIIVRMFGESLLDRHGERAVVLARLYATVARRELPADVDAWLAKRHGAVGTHTTCLTLPPSGRSPTGAIAGARRITRRFLSRAPSR